MMGEFVSFGFLLEFMNVCLMWWRRLVFHFNWFFQETFSGKFRRKYTITSKLIIPLKAEITRNYVNATLFEKNKNFSIIRSVGKTNEIKKFKSQKLHKERKPTSNVVKNMLDSLR
jgi:hypothetical protein